MYIVIIIIINVSASSFALLLWELFDSSISEVDHEVALLLLLLFYYYYYYR